MGKFCFFKEYKVSSKSLNITKLLQKLLTKMINRIINKQ